MLINTLTPLKVVKNIPSTLRICSEFPILADAIENAVEYALSADDDAVIYVLYDNIHAVTIEKYTNDYIRCYFFNNKSKKFKICDAFSFSRASFLITRATLNDELIIRHLDNVKTFTVTIAK